MYQRISSLQLTYIVYFQVIGLGMLIYPITISQWVVRDAWMVGFTYMLGSAVVTAAIVCFVRTFPKLTLLEGIRSAFGPWLGSALGAWIMLWLMSIACVELLGTTLFLNSTLLPNTPDYMIAVLFIIPVSYAVFMGVEVLGRLSEIISPLSIALTVLLFLLAMKNAHFSHVKPVLADGFSPVLRGSLIPWASGMKLVLVLFLVPSLKENIRIGRTLLVAGFCIGMTGVFIELSTTLILGPSRTYTSYSILEVVRSIRIGSFVERLDTIYVTLLIVTTFVNAIVIHYCIATGLKQLLGLPRYRPLVWCSGLLIWTCTIFFFPNSQKVRDDLLFALPGYYYCSGLLVPLLAVVTYRLRGKSKQKTA